MRAELAKKQATLTSIIGDIHSSAAKVSVLLTDDLDTREIIAYCEIIRKLKGAKEKIRK